MAIKLNRGRKPVFRRRHTGWIKAVVTVIVCAALVGLGIWIASMVSDTAPDAPQGGTGSTASSSTTTVKTTTTTTASTPAAPTARRAFYITTAQLRDTDALETLLASASKAGYNGVVFDLKDADGNVLYQATTAQAEKADAVTDDAFTKEQLQTIATLCRANGIEPMPRLFAFRDKTAPSALVDARIKLQGDSSMMWLDNKRDKGGKSWLNPCSEAAWNYVLGLCAELKQLGFTAQVLEGVQFPEQDSRADYGNGSLAALERGEVLARFIAEAQKQIGDELVISVSGLSALGTYTAGYHGNPLMQGMHIAAPRLIVDELGKKLSFDGETVTVADDPAAAVTVALKQIAAYSRIMDVSSTVMPWIAADGKTDAAQIKALEDGGVSTYILYHKNGTYTFS